MATPEPGPRRRRSRGVSSESCESRPYTYSNELNFVVPAFQPGPKPKRGPIGELMWAAGFVVVKRRLRRPSVREVVAVLLGATNAGLYALALSEVDETRLAGWLPSWLGFPLFTLIVALLLDTAMCLANLISSGLLHLPLCRPDWLSPGWLRLLVRPRVRTLSVATASDVQLAKVRGEGERSPLSATRRRPSPLIRLSYDEAAQGPPSEPAEGGGSAVAASATISPLGGAGAAEGELTTPRGVLEAEPLASLHAKRAGRWGCRGCEQASYYWLSEQPDAHLLSRTVLRLAWCLLYLSYTGFATREACFFNPPQSTQCDAWDHTSVPAALLVCEAVLLWSHSIGFAVRLTFRADASRYLTTFGCLVKLVQLPTLLLLWRKLLAHSPRSSWRGASVLDMSLQLGWAHMLLLLRSKGLERIALSLLSRPASAKLLVAVLNLVAVVLAFSGAVYWLVAARLSCSELPVLELAPDDEPPPPPGSGWWDRPWEVGAVREAAALDEELSAQLIDACGAAGLSTYLDFMYYAVVTISTVGYGDFSPPDTTTRVLAILMMIFVVTYIPYEVSTSVELVKRLRDFCLGSLPKPSQPFVALLGPISPRQLQMFVEEFMLARHAAAEGRTHIVVLSPLPLDTYRQVLASVRGEHAGAAPLSSRLYVQRSDVLAAASFPVDLSRARALFVFSDTESAAPLAEDRHAVIRCLVLRKLLAPERMRAVSVQLNRARDKKLALDLNAGSALALNELKMALLAVSATRCFGLATLLTNMLVCHNRESTPSWPGLAAAESEYLIGVSHEPFQVVLPHCCVGRPWCEIVGLVYLELHLVLLARVRRADADGGAAASAAPLSPDELRGGSAARLRLEVDAGSTRAVEAGCVALVLGYSREQVDALASLAALDKHETLLSAKLDPARAAWRAHLLAEDERQRRAQRQFDLRYAAAARTAAEAHRGRRSSAECAFHPAAAAAERARDSARAPSCASASEGEAPERAGAPDRLSNKPVTFDEVLVPEPLVVSSSVSGRRFVLAVCPAWPANVRVFLNAVVGCGDFSCVLLCREPPPSESEEFELCSYVDECGKPLVQLVVGDGMRRPQLHRAGVQHAHVVVIFSAFRGARAAERRAEAGADGAGAEADFDAVLLSAKINKFVAERRKIPVVTELHHPNAVRFLDPTGWWPSDPKDELAYLQAPTFASGHCFAESMLYPLVNYTLFLPLLPMLLQELIDFEDHQQLLQDQQQHRVTLGRERLQLWLIPAVFHARCFRELFRAMLAEGLLAIGLLRAPHPGADAAPFPFVLTCPTQSTVINPGDRVYVILPNTPKPAATPAADAPAGPSPARSHWGIAKKAMTVARLQMALREPEDRLSSITAVSDRFTNATPQEIELAGPQSM